MKIKSSFLLQGFLEPLLNQKITMNNVFYSKSKNFYWFFSKMMILLVLIDFDPSYFTPLGNYDLT